MKPPLLELRDLCITLRTPAGPRRAVEQVSLTLQRGQTMALVGESGSGKTLTALACARLLPESVARVDAGEVLFDGAPSSRLSEADFRLRVRPRIGMVFQDPLAALNPILRVGRQIAEVAEARGIARRTAEEAARALLGDVGLPGPGVFDAYPHQLSGGMRQRVMLAVALAGGPELLIADEPTTALDVTVQARILDLLADVQRRRGLGLLLITHDLGVVARMADAVAVMYTGQIVETAAADEFFAAPRHPYSRALLESVRGLDEASGRLPAIGGAPPRLGDWSVGCRFAPRCPLGAKDPRCEAPDAAAWIAQAGRAWRCWKVSP